MDQYGAFLHSQNIHAFPLKTILRNVKKDDAMSGKTSAEISKYETSMLKSRGRGNDICGLISTYRLLDVMADLESSMDLLHPPQHQKMAVDFIKPHVSAAYQSNHLPYLNLSDIRGCAS